MSWGLGCETAVEHMVTCTGTHPPVCNCFCRLIDIIVQSRQLKEAEAKIFQLADAAKRVDAKRRELLRQSEHQAIRIRALEAEVDRQLAVADDLRTQVSLVHL